ncbi:MAG: hypothetical protein KBD16_00745 [Candidatus Pacebacteria bacterium]|nr:hypothetical protein [Candidatus Paceibacterota bacterium]
MEILLILCFFLGSFGVGYQVGWFRREERFQKVPITYTIGSLPVAFIDNNGPRTRITIYNRDLVELELPRGAAAQKED